MSTTPKFGIVRLVEGQTGAEVGVNDGNNKLDALVGLKIIDRDLNSPPGSPAEGDSYIVGPSGSGAWSGQSNKIAVYSGGGWLFISPWEGATATIADEGDAFVVYTGTKWRGPRSAGAWQYNYHVGTAVGQRWHLPVANATALTTGALTQHRLHAVPFIAPRGGTIDRIGVEVTTAVASSNLRMGIYDSVADNDARPNNLVAGSDVGQVSSATTGLKTNTFASPIRLTPGQLYWLVVTTASAGVSVRSIPVAAAIPLLGFPDSSGFGTTPAVGFNLNRTSASPPTVDALPSTYGSPASGDLVTTGTNPAVGLLVSD